MQDYLVGSLARDVDQRALKPHRRKVSYTIDSVVLFLIGMENEKAIHTGESLGRLTLSLLSKRQRFSSQHLCCYSQAFIELR